MADKKDEPKLEYPSPGSGISNPIDPTAVPVREHTTTQTLEQNFPGFLQRGVMPESKWEMWWDQARHNLVEELDGALWTIWERKKIEARNNPKISAEEANRRFPGMPEAFTDPIDPLLAEMSYQEFIRRQAHQVWMERGPEVGIPFHLTAGIAASFASPTNQALNLATMGLFSAFKIPMKLAGVVAENLLQNVATEGVIRTRMSMENQPLTWAESAMNVTAGTAAGTGFHYLFRAMTGMGKAGAQKTIESIQAMPPGRVRRIFGRFIKAHESGQKPPAATPTRAGVAELTPAQADPHAVDIQISHPSERQFYLPEHSEVGSPAPVGEGFGGTTLTDNPTYARTRAAGDVPGENGSVRVADIDPNGKFLSLDTPAADPSVSKIIASLKARGIGADLPENATLRDFLRQVKELDADHLTTAREEFTKNGISGLTEVVDSPQGRANVLHLFETERAKMSEPMELDQAKLADPSRAELEQMQARQDAPENRRFYKPRPEIIDKITDPEGKQMSAWEFEATQARRYLDKEAELDADLKKELADIDALEKYDQGFIPIVQEIMDQSISSMDPNLHIREGLLKKGIAASEDDLAYFSETLDGIKAASRDELDYRQRVSRWMESEDLIDFARLRKAERVMNKQYQQKILAIAKQDRPGANPEDRVGALVDFLTGGGNRLGDSQRVNTHTMYEGLALDWLARMRTALGDNLKAAESGLLKREITQELAALQQGLPSGASKSKQAVEIAKAFHEIMEEIFAVKSGYTPFLRKIENYFYRQSHNIEKIKKAGFEAWSAFIQSSHSSSFENMTPEIRDKWLKSLYMDITEGTYRSSIFDRAAGDNNLAFKMARKRSLTPDSWQSFYEYNEMFGTTDVFQTMVKMIESAARDVSVMSKFGSTPRANIQAVIKKLSKDPAVKAAIQKVEGKIQDAMHIQTFSYGRPLEGVVARVNAGIRKQVTLSANGNVLLQSMMDFASAAAATSTMDGSNLFTNAAGIMTGWFGSFAGQSRKNAVKAAEQMGIMVDSANRNMYLEIGTAGEPGRMDKWLQLYSHLTLAEKDKASKSKVIGERVSSKLAEYAKTPYNKLTPYVQGFLKKHGISEAGHAFLKYGVRKADDGIEYFDAATMRSELLKRIQAGVVDPTLDVPPKFLEKLPPVVLQESDSVYNQKGNPYYRARDFLISPRTGEGAGDFGVNMGPLSAFSVESASRVAADVHQRFLDSGFTEHEAGVGATLYSTFFDSVGRMAGKSPEEMFSAYNLVIERGHLPSGVAGQMTPFKKSVGKSTIMTMRGVPFDKTVLHESAHFFLETLTDVHRMEGLNPEFKADLDGLYSWLGVKDYNVTVAAHERFVNSFEVFLRTGKAPQSGLERVFQSIRDWYRRAFEMVRRGFGSIPVSLAHGERAPQHIENFYNKLLGGTGQAELHGPLSYAPESMGADVLYAVPATRENARVPNDLMDVILRAGAIVNDIADKATTTAGAPERAFMFGSDDPNSWQGQVSRLFWQFRSATLKTFNTMQEYRFSDPMKPQGDWTKVASFVALSSSLYVMKETLKALSSGKTPEDPATPGYIMKALAESGSLNILGDAIGREVADMTNPRDMAYGLFKALSPAMSRALDAGSTAAVTVGSAFSDDIRFPGTDVGRNLVQNVPGQNIFWAKALMHHYFLNAIREELSHGFLSNLERRTSKTPGLLDDEQRYFMMPPTGSFMWTEAFY